MLARGEKVEQKAWQNKTIQVMTANQSLLL